MKTLSIGYSLNYSLLNNGLTTNTKSLTIDDIKSLIAKSEIIMVFEPKLIPDITNWLEGNGVDDYSLQTPKKIGGFDEGDVFIKICPNNPDMVQLITMVSK